MLFRCGSEAQPRTHMAVFLFSTSTLVTLSSLVSPGIAHATNNRSTSPSRTVKQVKTGAKEAVSLPRPQVDELTTGSYEGHWPGDPVSFIMFERDGTNGLTITDIYKSPDYQASGVGGIMIADAFKETKLPRPTIIRVTGVVEKDTKAALKAGTDVSETKFAWTLTNAIEAMGGRVKPGSFHSDPMPGDQYEIRVEAEYDTF